MKVLLDTCTFLWIASGADDLSTTARKVFSDPANEVFLSVVSGWEIVVKHALGRLPLPAPPGEFVPELRRLHHIDTLPPSEDAVFQLARLPPYHRDPFDRMLVCQAVAGGMVILTPDRAISQYPVQTLW